MVGWATVCPLSITTTESRHFPFSGKENGSRTRWLTPLGIPHRNDDLLMWLIGFNKETRAHSESEYEDLLSQRKSEYRWWGYRDWTTADEGFKFSQCNRSDCGGHYNLAAWVQTPMTKELVKRVLRAMRGVMFPETFTKKLLRDRFGFTDEDLQGLDTFVEVEGLENVFYN